MELKYKYSELPKKLRFHYLKHIILAFLVTICFAITAFTTKMYADFLLLAGCSLLYTLYECYKIYGAMHGKVSQVLGACIRIDNKSIQLIGNTNLRGTCYLYIDMNDVIYEVPVSNSFPAKVGDAILVYAEESGIYKTEDREYSVTNPILVNIEKRI